MTVRLSETVAGLDPRPPEDLADPRRDYAGRLAARDAGLERLARVDRAIADGRLALFAVFLALAGLAFWAKRVERAWVFAPLAGLAALVVVHENVRKAKDRAGRASTFYEKGLRRLDGAWPGTGTTGVRFEAPDHPYAADLDLFGVGSLFERLCTAKTRAGEEALASWLLAPAEPATVARRQEAVDEARPRLDLREEIEVLGAGVREGIDPDALARWGEAAPVYTTRAASRVSAGLGVLAAAAVVAWVATDLGLAPLLAVMIAQTGLAILQRSKVNRVLGPLDRSTRDLVLLSGLLARLEREPFRSPELARLREALQTGGEPASRRVARLAALLALLEAKNNQVFAPFAFLLGWSVHLATAVDAWRVRTGPMIAGWVKAVGEFEAIFALSAYAFENPDDPFPVVEGGEALYEGEAVGHPLIAGALCVRNDVRLGGDLRALLVSGSNMSGKSTLLRTVGANAVLAYAGAPVRAARLRLSVLNLGATLRVQDSLQAGRSRFFAELTRLKQLVEIASGERPLLFLLDEVFHGTNSHDRAVGASALVRGLIDRGAVGLVTTHDLALAEVADALAPRAANVHFEDQLVDGVMTFDYRMRPGVVRHSNALALMKAVGLDV